MKKINSVLFLSLLLSTNSFANSSNKLKDALKNYKSGSYKKVITDLKSVKGNQNTQATKHYLMALSYNRLQDYDLALIHFRKAIKSGAKTEDVYYEFGQALYANNDLSKARKAFKKSYKKGFKKESSLYYIAHISQILEEHKIAKSYYVKLIKSKSTDKNMLQVARFQLSEVLLSMARNNPESRRLVEKFVLPQMEKAIKVNEGSGLSSEIYARKKEIEREFGLDPNILYNGRKIKSKRWKASIDQRFIYDNNISLTNDLAASAASLEDSFILRTKAQAAYDYIAKKKFIISPEVNIDYKQHTNSDSEAVKGQNSYDITSSLNNSFEHKLFNNPASLIFDYSYNYTSRYKTELNRKSFYSRYNNYTLGEKFKFFSKGETTFKLKYKDLKSHNVKLNSKTKTFSADQVLVTLRGNIFLLLFSYDSMDTYNDTTSSTKSTLLRVDYINPTVLPNINLHLGASMTFIDYVDAAESASRGVEKTFTPLVKLTKKVTKKLKFSISYEYTKNTSLKEDFKYTKHVTTSALKYNF
jgi:hypothetical protein